MSLFLFHALQLSSPMSSQTNGGAMVPPASRAQRTFLDDVILTFSSPMAWLLVLALILTWSGVAIVLFDLLDYDTLAGNLFIYYVMFLFGLINIWYDHYLHHSIKMIILIKQDFNVPVIFSSDTLLPLMHYPFVTFSHQHIHISSTHCSTAFNTLLKLALKVDAVSWRPSSKHTCRWRNMFHLFFYSLFVICAFVKSNGWCVHSVFTLSYKTSSWAHAEVLPFLFDQSLISDSDLENGFKGHFQRLTNIYPPGVINW